jgi:AcrR family transcriptional regulator
MTGRPALARLDDPTERREGEFAKSGRTRAAILDAGVQLLADHGWQSLSAARVAEAAEVARATMIYHFPSRAALVAALIAHVTRRRIEMYETAIAALPRDASFRARAVDLAWEQAATPAFAAFAELAQAARTDRELGGMFRPAMAAFDQARREAALRIFPADLAQRPDFDLRRDVLRFLTEGIVQQDGPVYNREARLDAMRHFLRLLVSSPEGEALLERVTAETAPDAPPERAR